MYPYHQNTQVSQRNQLSARESKDLTLSELAADQRLLALLHLAMEETAQTEARFRRLAESYPIFAPSAQILKSMALDEQKNGKRLQEIYYTITKRQPEKKTPENTPSTLEELDPETFLEQMLLSEMDQVNFYRNFLLAIPSGELRDLFFEILTDKQNHVSGLTYLYSKYFSGK